MKRQRGQDPPTLFAHQQTALEFMLQREKENPASWFIGDEMGVGKTREVIALMHRSDVPGPWLVVIPKTGVSTWMEQIRLYSDAEKWNVEVVLIENAQGIEFYEDDENKIIIITYNLLGMIHKAYAAGGGTRDAKRMYDHVWNRVILDEIHTIRNPLSVRNRACMALQARCRGAMSGTPIQNYEQDIKSIATFLGIGLVSDLVRKHMLRRMIADVAKTDERLQLPAISFYKMVWPFTSDEERTAYAAEIAAASNAAIQWDSGHSDSTLTVTAILRSRMMCAAKCCIGGDRPDLLSGPPSWENTRSTKMSMLVEYCQKHHESDILVFSEWSSVLKVARTSLMAENLGTVVLLTGETSSQNADQMIKGMFAREDRRPRIALVSVKAHAECSNWPFFNRVVFLTPSWNPQQEYQAWKRTHRFGQEREVIVTYFIIAGTIEERVRSIAEGKKNLEHRLLDPTHNPKILLENVLKYLPDIEHAKPPERFDEETAEVGMQTSREQREQSEQQTKMRNLVNLALPNRVPLGEAYPKPVVMWCKTVDDWENADEEAGFPFPNVFVPDGHEMGNYRQPFTTNTYRVKFREDAMKKTIARVETPEHLMSAVSAMAIQAGMSDPRLQNFKLYDMANALRQAIGGEELESVRSARVPVWGVQFDDGGLLAFWPLRFFETI